MPHTTFCVGGGRPASRHPETGGRASFCLVLARAGRRRFKGLAGQLGKYGTERHSRSHVTAKKRFPSGFEDQWNRKPG